jgi:cation/acetate symporter
MAVTIFLCFVGFVLGLSFYLGKKAKSAGGYFAAGGQIHWAVNGIAFAGDYLSAASFLGICGMIATKGYDGFLYSIGYLAGWIVALFVVAEPMKRMGKYTFTDALDAKFNSKGIQLVAALSTLIVSIFYLIPQMVGAGTLVEPLLHLPHYVGVIMVGLIVTFIVATAGMASTTYVQFLKGALLIVFSTWLTISVCQRGLTTSPTRVAQDENGKVHEIPHHDYGNITYTEAEGGAIVPGDGKYSFTGQTQTVKNETTGKVSDFVLLKNPDGNDNWWLKVTGKDGELMLSETATQTVRADSSRFINGRKAIGDERLQASYLSKIRGKANTSTGSVGPFEFLATICDEGTEIKHAGSPIKFEHDGNQITAYPIVSTAGSDMMVQGQKFKTKTFWEKINFVSLMLALFCGTAALPHILIRYYTVPSQAAARKSTILAIAAIGFFYILTMYMGMGAMLNCTVDPSDGNLSAPLLAKGFGIFLFAVISAIAFATVLGTVSGLIVAASGAVAHDIMDRYAGMELTDRGKVLSGKIAAAVVGVIAIILGILFQGVNVSFLVGWAFAVAASANLPAIIMILFWDKTTAKGVVASILSGIVSSLTIILLSPDMYAKYLGISVTEAVKFAPMGNLSNPGLISIPLSFIVLVVVSLMTGKKEAGEAA